MITNTCPITGIKLSIPSGLTGIAGRAAHPITTVPLAQLNSQTIGAGDGMDDYLILAGYIGYLSRAGAIRITAPMRPSLFTADWLRHHIGPIAKIANWLALNGATAGIAGPLPAFAIDSLTTKDNIGAWLAACEEAISVASLLYRPMSADGRTIAGAGSRPITPAPESLPAMAASTYLVGAQKYLRRCFWDRRVLSLDACQRLEDTILHPQGKPLNALNHARQELLAYGIIKNSEDQRELDGLLARLDKAILAQIGSVKGLMDRVENRERREAANATATAHAIPVPTSQPKASDYPNRAAFIVACNKWRKAQATSEAPASTIAANNNAEAAQ